VAVYRGRIRVPGGWSKEQDDFDDVRHSTDGGNWDKPETRTIWKARQEYSVFVFRDRLWIVGAHAKPLSNGDLVAGNPGGLGKSGGVTLAEQ